MYFKLYCICISSKKSIIHMSSIHCSMHFSHPQWIHVENPHSPRRVSGSSRSLRVKAKSSTLCGRPRIWTLWFIEPMIIIINFMQCLYMNPVVHLDINTMSIINTMSMMYLLENSDQDGLCTKEQNDIMYVMHVCNIHCIHVHRIYIHALIHMYIAHLYTM